MIQKVADSIAYLDRRSRNTIFTRLRTLVETLTALNVFVAGGAAIMYGVSSHLQGLPATRSGAVIAYLYFFSMYLWNSLASIESTRHHGIGRYRIYQKHKKGLYAVSMAATAAMFLLARQRSLPVFLILLFATLAGTAYHLTIVPRRMRSLMRYRNLKDIPTSRDLFVSLAWATVLTFLPWRSSAVQPLPALFCFGWIGILAYLRSVIFDLRDIEGDRIMGRETLVTIVGEKRIRAALLAVLPLALTGLLVYPAILLLTQQGIPGRGYAFIIQIPVLVYIFLFLKYNNRIGLAKTTVFTLLADGQFYLSGALALGMWTISRLL